MKKIKHIEIKLVLFFCFAIIMVLKINLLHAQSGYKNGCDFCNKGDTPGSSGAQSSVMGSSGPESFAANNLLNLTVLLEGSWNGSSQIPDSITCYLRNSEYPYNIAESATALLNTNGEGLFVFSKLSAANFYYIVVKHKNSIETWSSTPISVYHSGNQYDFTTASTQAVGDNMILKDGRYCIYSGDINQDGTIDIQDLSMIDNIISGNSTKNNVRENSTKDDARDKSPKKDAKDNSTVDKVNKDFTMEDAPEDCTGDNVVDVSDAAIVDNNAFKQVTVITPLIPKKIIHEPIDKKINNEDRKDYQNKEGEIKK